ncbi:MAG TPA: T9SS type A sorting domain-containing protein [Bacteroidia bacterium]|nr:T9SS type A sorting domain-containing protein [Bacteroidia bacterium]
MKKKLLIVFLFISKVAFPQEETANWYFGVYAGLHFQAGGPVANPSTTLVTNEGTSAISDAAGDLLFYTDGISVWNKLHNVMANGSGLMGGISSTQSALIVPQPGSANLFFIFTTDEIGGPNGFRYSIVDMNLQNGTGDITSSKNVLVLNNVTEKLTAVKQANATDYWIAIHEWGTNAFYVYSLTAAGLQPAPVISNTGIIHTTAVIQNTYGQMKFSFCGDKIVSAIAYLDTVEIFDFDNATGIVSNPVSLPLFDHVYGVEFSGDQHLLYVSTYDPNGTLVQFDLTAGSTAAIIASKTMLSLTPDIYALQMASDGKIYVCRSFSAFLGVINDPSIPGTGCNYLDNGIDLDPNFTGATSALGLPNFVQSNFRSEITCSPNSANELNAGNSLTVYPNPFSDNFMIQFSRINQPSEIVIYDAIGKRVDTFMIGQNQKSFSYGKSLSNGIYFVFIKNDSGQDVIKVVKTGVN